MNLLVIQGWQQKEKIDLLLFAVTGISEISLTDDVCRKIEAYSLVFTQEIIIGRKYIPYLFDKACIKMDLLSKNAYNISSSE